MLKIEGKIQFRTKMEYTSKFQGQVNIEIKRNTTHRIQTKTNHTSKLKEVCTFKIKREIKIQKEKESETNIRN